MKRRMLLFMCTCMMILLMCASVPAATSGTCGANLTWKLDAQGTLTIQGSGPMDNYAYSSTEGVKPANPMPWHDVRYQIKKVVIGENVTSIGEYAFYNESTWYNDTRDFWDSISSVEFSQPSKLQSIGWRAFYKCNGFSEITIPDGVKSIDEHAFEDCVVVNHASFGSEAAKALSRSGNIFTPEGSKLSYYYTFSGNQVSGLVLFSSDRNITEITIPGEVTEIESGAFNRCSLTSIRVPDNVKMIGDRAFSICADLTTAVFPDQLKETGEYIFSDCHALKSFKIPDSMTLISDGFFYNCGSLKTVTIPKGITRIGEEVFYGCDSLAEIIVPDDTCYAYQWCMDNGFEEIVIAAASSSAGKEQQTSSSGNTDKNSDTAASSDNAGKSGDTAASSDNTGKSDDTAASSDNTGKNSDTAASSDNAGKSSDMAATQTKSKKKANPITIKVKKVTVSYRTLKKKSVTVAAKKAFSVKKAKGKVTYKKISGSKKITVSKAGKITVKKKLKKGTYKIGVKVTAAGNKSYKSKSRKVNVVVVVR